MTSGAQAGHLVSGRTAPVQGNPIATFLPLILLVVVFYFLLIRPQRRRQQEQTRLQNSLTAGSRVMTTTGLFATVIVVEDDDVVLEIAPGVETRWLKAAIGRVLTSVEAPGDDASSATDATDPTDSVDDSDTKARGDDEDSTSKKS
jgi:preprotein translocase, YajC subunit